MHWLALLACGTPAPPDGVLLHVSERGGAPAVWAVGTDGSGARALQAPEGIAFPGAPDPQGTHALVVAVQDDDQGHRESMWLLPLAGGEPVRLAPNAGRIRNPSWAPDGSWLAFEADALSFRDLYRVPREGSRDPTRLTDADHGSFEPAISPDGTQIALGTSRDGNAEIYVMKSDGTEPRRLTNHIADDVKPRWSPDGKWLTWVSFRDDEPRVWRSAGGVGHPHALRPPASPATDMDYAWAPDGTKLAIAVQSGPKEVDVHVVQASDGALLATLGGAGVDEHPTWSPDSAWIAWSATRDGETDVVLARADGKHERKVTTAEGPDWLPRWVAKVP